MVGLSKQPVTINGIEFDALIDESRTLEATVPEYAVEDGYSISDAILRGAESLSMTLFVTSTPVTWFWRHGISKSRVSEVVKQLEELYYAGEPVTITTSENTYTNMAIESLTITKNVESGNAREIPISFKKINITKAKTTTIPDSYGKSGTTKSASGSANTKSGSSSSNSSASTSSASSSGSSSGSSSSSSGTSSGSSSKSSILYKAAKGSGLLN